MTMLPKAPRPRHLVQYGEPNAPYDGEINMCSDKNYEYFKNKLTGKTYVSKMIQSSRDQRRIRIASKVEVSDEAQHFAMKKDELIVRVTDGYKYEYRATFTEDDRKISGLTFQRYDGLTGRPHDVHFSFRPREIDTFLEFVANIKRINFPDSSNVNLTDEELKNLIASPNQVRRLVADNEELVAEIARSEITIEDVEAWGYRRKQLVRFEQLLEDPVFFDTEKHRLKKTKDEDVWQEFFEQNKWIFGYGLSYVFASELDDKKLEQWVQGFDLQSPGKRADGVLKTVGLLSALCFVEIKTHKTELLKQVAKPYRTGCWAISDELTGAIAQLQGTVHGAVHSLGTTVVPKTQTGDPTGEVVYNFQPKSFLVVGRLCEFQTEAGDNADKFRSFELYRRNLVQPEIITFDELYGRAKFIVDNKAPD
jgi:hypothetical protein